MPTKFLVGCLGCLGCFFILTINSYAQYNGSQQQLSPSIQQPFLTASNQGYMLASFSAVGTSSVGSMNILMGKTPYYFDWPAPPNPTLNTYGCNVRDSSIINWGGTYALTHTSNGGSGSGCTALGYKIPISYATSGVSGFAAPIELDVSGTITTSGNAWAPEWFADPQNCTYTAGGAGWSCSSISNLHIFFAGCTSGIACFQIYEIHPTASDFFTNTASWSTPTLITITGETSNIDPFMIWLPSASKYYLFYKTQPASGQFCINWATSSTLTGAYTDISTNNCFGISNYVEAPMLIQTVAGSPGTWMLCGVPYNNTYYEGSYECELTTNGFGSFGSVFPLGGPVQLDHGTMIPYP